MTWLSDERRGGGLLGALGSHHTDCLRLFFGEPRSALASVRVDQPRRGPTPTDARAGIATADDACTVLYRFDDDALGLIDLSGCAPYRWERFEIHGAEASLRWDETGYRLWRLVAGREPEPLEIPERLALAPREGEPALLAPFGALLDRFHQALSGGPPMEPDFGDAVAVQSALDAVRHSSDAAVPVGVSIPVPVTV
jgi:predicted dehydrogenase